ncbi:MAG: indole-3-glycerol phosphate synthase [Candidatus Nanopelagicales bacterium]
MFTIIAVTEKQLTAHDVQRLAHLHDPDPVIVHVVVPFHEGGLVESLDDLALGHRPGDDDVPDADQESVASDAAASSVQALLAGGVSEAFGTTAPSDPVVAVREVADRVQADEVWVFTEPHLIQDSFRRDWGSRIRREVPLPVLHVVAGTDRLLS